jgi:hypothetical protein
MTCIQYICCLGIGSDAAESTNKQIESRTVCIGVSEEKTRTEGSIGLNLTCWGSTRTEHCKKLEQIIFLQRFAEEGRHTCT